MEKTGQQGDGAGESRVVLSVLNLNIRASLVVQGLRIQYQCRGHGYDPWSRRTTCASG